LAAATYLSSKSEAGFQKVQTGELSAVIHGNLRDSDHLCAGLKYTNGKNYKP